MNKSSISSGPLLAPTSSVRWGAYRWGLRLLRWLISFPLAVIVTAGISISLGNEKPSTTEALLSFLGILMLGAGLSIWLSRSGPLRHKTENASVRGDAMHRGREIGRIAGRAGLATALFAVNFIIWFVPMMLVDELAGQPGTTGGEILGYLAWCGLWTWLLLRYGGLAARKWLDRHGASASGVASPSVEVKPGIGVGLDNLESSMLADGRAAAPAISEQAGVATPSSIGPPTISDPARAAEQSDFSFGTSAAKADPGAPAQPDPADVRPSPWAIQHQFLSELDELQRHAIWLLQQHRAVTVGELAGALDLRPARVSGFMNGLNRQLAALGCQCFRTETLPSGEQQYVFIPQETRP